jgi:autotransporter translocation and assembly factor TamB
VFELHGLDPVSGDLYGGAQLHDGRMPLSATVGTMRQISLDISIARRTVTAKLEGRLGGGKVGGTATVTLVGATPSHAELTATLRQVALIGPIEPVITADIAAKLAFANARWTGNVDVTNGTVSITTTENDVLLAAGAPADMSFVDGTPAPDKTKRAHHVPEHPWLVTAITIGPTTIEADEAQGVITGKLGLSIGDDVALDGTIEAVRADAEIFGRRYQVDHASVAFDGEPDPMLNVRLIHDFTDVTLMADVSGRASKPDLALSSDPGIYTQGQLLGFFLGGEPGGDPSSASRDAATGAGASVLSSAVGKRLNKVLPVKLDVLTYEAGTSTSSGAVRAGTWISRKLFVAYRGHPEARPDENANEGEIEYYLPHNWILQGTAGDRGIGGGDMVHRWRW